MARQVRAGDLRDKVTFQSRTTVDDGYGNTVSGPFKTEFTISAHMAPLRGGEDVLASRLTGVQPYIITVRRSSQTRDVTTDWRIVDARDDTRIFNIKSITDPDGRRQWLDMLATAGEAT